jgi:hypothetical protein
MSTKGKYIGINQRIPFEVLDSAISSYMENGEVDRTYVLQLMQEFTVGINRANKAAAYVLQILTRQQFLLDKLRKLLAGEPYYSLKVDDRKALNLCLISLTYPITYDLLVALSQGFKVQSLINKKFINEKVMSLYGSNRTVDIAIDALLPMIIELQTIKRERVSQYSIAQPLSISYPFVFELIIFSDILLSGSKTMLIDGLTHKPWYMYFDLSRFSNDNFRLLLKKKDSAVGNGYITI